MALKAKQLTIHLSKAGLSIRGARNIGATCGAIGNTKKSFLGLCEYWWDTYFEGYRDEKSDGNMVHGPAIEALLEELRSGEYEPLAGRIEAALMADGGMITC